ncbi:uncharacterized protein TNCV_519981 [Trichonephila clavipes]|nr:uncharacterized protein TNCV_519981 [Trichonephila clavipes]
MYRRNLGPYSQKHLEIDFRNLLLIPISYHSRSFALREKGSNHLVPESDYMVDALKLLNLTSSCSKESLQKCVAWNTTHLLANSGQSLDSNGPVVDSRDLNLEFGHAEATPNKLFLFSSIKYPLQLSWQLVLFQQDGATCPTARATIDLLKDTLGDRLISRFGPVNWPPRSCDLTPLDYFLWGYVKSLVYADKPQTLDHLEDNIRHVIADIRPQMLGLFHKNIQKKSSKIGRPDWTTSSQPWQSYARNHI